MLAKVLQIITVVERDLLGGSDVAQRDDPNTTIIIELGFCIRRATVIDEAGDVRFDAAVEVELVVDLKNIIIPLAAVSQRLLLGDSLADVFNDMFSGPNHCGRKAATALNRGVLDFQRRYFVSVHLVNPISSAEKLYDFRNSSSGAFTHTCRPVNGSR